MPKVATKRRVVSRPISSTPNGFLCDSWMHGVFIELERTRHVITLHLLIKGYVAAPLIHPVLVLPLTYNSQRSTHSLSRMLPSNFLTGKQTIALVRSGEVSLAQVIQDHQDRHQERGHLFNAWVTVRHQQCIQDAEASPVMKPLTGMILGVKDIIGTSTW